MTLDQIDNEVSGYLRALENMEDRGIINKMERSMIRTKIKAWAYDQTKEVIATDNISTSDRQTSSGGTDDTTKQIQE